MHTHFLRSIFLVSFILLLFQTGCKEKPVPVPDSQYFKIIMDGVVDEYSWGITESATPIGGLLTEMGVFNIESAWISLFLRTDNDLAFQLYIKEVYSLDDITEGTYPLGCQFNFSINHPSSCGSISTLSSEFDHLKISEVIPAENGDIWIKGTISDGTGVFTPGDYCLAGETVALEGMEFTFYLQRPFELDIIGTGMATLDGEELTFESSKKGELTDSFGATDFIFRAHYSNGHSLYVRTLDFELPTSFPITYPDIEIDVRAWNGCYRQWYSTNHTGGSGSMTIENIYTLDGKTRISGSFEGTAVSCPSGRPPVEVTLGTFDVEY